MAYQPIENHGIVGDLHTVALVGLNGSIDWLCYPHFDSPSVFAAILDDQRGGHFSIRPAFEGYRCKQFYWPETNVLGYANHLGLYAEETGPSGRPSATSRRASRTWR